MSLAKKPRLEEAGASYHVINRGNYRRDLFDSPGTGSAFLETLFEAATKFGVAGVRVRLMRNHFHLTVETVEPTLGEGMHWLQGTMAVRFNRFRQERGHLFQAEFPQRQSSLRATEVVLSLPPPETPAA